MSTLPTTRSESDFGGHRKSGHSIVVSRIRQEVFRLFESSVKRAFDRGLIADSLGATGVTIAIWSILNGAFMVTRDREYLVHTIGFEPEGFVAKALDSYLQGLAAAARAGTRQSKTGSTQKTAHSG